MTIKEALNWAEELFNKKKIKGPKSSSRFLLFHVLSEKLEYIYSNKGINLTRGQEKLFKSLVKKRLNHKPVWQIIGKVKFWGLDFSVNQDVLIPRQETELLVERILQEILIKNLKINQNSKIKNRNLSIIDIGTGSGAIICALKKELPNSSCFASDISKKAIVVAKKNAKTHNLDIVFKVGDLFDPWERKKIDIIVANLPYIPHERLPYLDKDVTQYEPLIALDGGKNGTEIYERFLNQVKKHTKNNTIIYCEIDHTHSNFLKKMAQKVFIGQRIEIMHDYAGKERFIIIYPNVL